MSNDYLKQLQLTKQLEQKAKEATKKRKAAEDTLAKAEQTLAKAKGPDIDLSEAEATLAKANAAFSKRDYTAALAAAHQVLEEVPQARRAAVTAVLKVSEGILSLVSGDGREAEAAASMAKARSLAEQGEAKEALAAARTSQEQAEKYVGLRASETIAGMHALITLAEGQGLAVGERKKVLGEAEDLLKQGERAAALERLRSGREELTKAFSAAFAARAAKLTAVIEGARTAGADLSFISSALTKARADLDGGAAEKALTGLAAAEKALSPALAKAVESGLSAQAARASWLEERGLRPEEFLTASGKAAEAVRAGRGPDSLEWLRRADKALRDSEAKAVLEEVQALRPGLLLARKFGSDLSGPLGKLEEARRAVQSAQARRAVELVAQAATQMEGVLKGHRELEEELQKTARLFRRAHVARVDTLAAGAEVARSRETALRGDLEGATRKLREAQSLLFQKVRRHCAEAILDAEVDVAFGLGMGADLAPESAELDELVRDLREGSPDDALIRLSRIDRRIRKKGQEQAAASVEEAEKAAAGIPGIELYLPVEGAREARRLLSVGDWKSAHLAAADVITRTGWAQRQALEEQMARASKLMDMARRLGCESITLDQKMAAAAAAPSATAALLTLGEVFQYIYAITRDELASSVASLTKEIGAQRQGGIAVTAAERTAEEATEALRRDDLERCFALFEESGKELQKTIAVHKEVGDLLALISMNVDGARPAAGKYGVPALLKEAKDLFEAGKYDGAKVAAKKCYQELEKTGASVLAPPKLREAREVAELLQQVVSRPTAADADIQTAAAALARGDHAAALAAAKDAHRKGTERLAAAIGAEIKRARSMLDRGKRHRLDLPASFDLIAEAESLLASKRYADAVRTLRSAQSEAEQMVRTERSARTEVERTGAELAEIEEQGIDLAEARRSMSQAREGLESGEQDQAAEAARQALKAARKAARTALTARLAALGSEQSADRRRGKDWESLDEEARRAVQDRLDRHRYAEAGALLDGYDAKLRALRARRDECAAALAEQDDPSRTSWPLMKEAADLEDRAQAAFREGAFGEAQALLKERQAARTAAQALHDRSAARLAEARRVLEEEGRRFPAEGVQALLERAEQDLAQGRYPEVEVSVMQAKAALEAAKEKGHRGDVAEVVRLTATLRLLGVNLYSLPERTQALLDMRMSELGEGSGIYLSEDIAALRKAAFDRLTSSETALHEKVGRAHASRKQVGVSEALLAESKKALSDGDPERAISLQKRARSCIGAAADDAAAHYEAVRRLFEALDLARTLDLDVSKAVALHQEASRIEGDLPSATRRIAEAAKGLEEQLARYLPAIRLQAVPEAAAPGGRRKVKVRAQNVGGGIALDLTVEETEGTGGLVLPEMLRPGETVEGTIESSGTSIELSYRGLMTSARRTAKASLT